MCHSFTQTETSSVAVLTGLFQCVAGATPLVSCSSHQDTFLQDNTSVDVCRLLSVSTISVWDELAVLDQILCCSSTDLRFTDH